MSEVSRSEPKTIVAKPFIVRGYRDKVRRGARAHQRDQKDSRRGECIELGGRRRIATGTARERGTKERRRKRRRSGDTTRACMRR